ncbi:MAG TPA: hypothetical protein EYP41_15965 [Anaerolineae bacterium]|nr:hypothetical protein [Anaerolineae bacterium]
MTSSSPPEGDKPVDPRKLLRVLSELFSEEDMRTLCFGLQVQDPAVEYDGLPGRSKRDKARELIIFYSHRKRIGVLVAAIIDLRPNISWDDIKLEESDEDPTSTNITLPPGLTKPQDKSKTLIASKSFTLLIRLMSRPDMRDAVIAFQKDFEAASEQIALMNDYKLVHDLFQELENRYYLIFNDQRRLPDDDLAWDGIAINEPELQGKIRDLLNVARNATFETADARWTEQLKTIGENIRTAVEEYNYEKLKSGTTRLYRILNRYPSRINAQLVTAAGALRLDSLAEAMNIINNNLSEIDVTLDNMTEEIHNGATALSSLDEQLTALVKEHNAWQEVDDEIRRVKASLNRNIEELENSWFDLEPMTRDLVNGQQEEWAISLAQVTDKLDEALAEKGFVTVRRTFLRYQSQVGRRFRQVDLNLLTLCQELQRIGESLDLVLRQFHK